MTSPTSAVQKPLANARLRIFLAAVAIRWVYDVALFAAMGREGLMGADSHGYLAAAQTMVAQASAGTLGGWAWLGADPGVMPIYPLFLALNVALFGSLAPLTGAMLQGVLDGVTCLMIYRLAQLIEPRFATAAAIAAAVNPSQIVVAGLLYNDSIFVLFAALALTAATAWLRQPSWRAAAGLGLGLGLAALDRIVIAPWAPVVVVLLLLAQAVRGRWRLLHVRQMAATAAIFCLLIAPVIGRNLSQYGAFALTPQGGAHLALWIVPLVQEAKDGTPWERSAEAMQDLRRARFGAQGSNPFANSKQFETIGRERLAQLGLAPLVKAWVTGMTINLGAPAIIISPPVAQLPRTGFFATRGKTPSEKIVNFLFHSDNARYAWILLIGIAGVGLIRLIQLAGAYAVLRDKANWPIAVMLVLWCGFILAASGPVASPKYRLPLEPVLCLLTGGGVEMLRRLRGRQAAA